MVLPKDKYVAFLKLKKGHKSPNNSLEKVEGLVLKKGKNFLDLKILYKDSEEYRLKFNFDRKIYEKDYIFLEGNKKIKKNKILVSNKKEVLELSCFVQDYLEDVLGSNYSLSKESTVSMGELKKDLGFLIKSIF